jgi:hypothetical protein
VSSAEVLYLKDGSRVSGKLTVCDEDHCVIASKSVPLVDIARIELRDDDGAPPLVAAGTIVLTDGTLQQARFLGLDLGVVETDGGDIDRENVALIILEPTKLKPPVALQRDVLIFADGSRSAGQLTSCSPASCMFDGERIQVDRLRWIGLRQEDGAPPGAAERADLVVVDERAVAARMSAVSAKSVRTTHGTFARDHVTWIHLSPKSSRRPPTPIPHSRSG